MSDVMRWRYGDTNPVTAPVDAATLRALRDVGWRPFVLAGALWVFISTVTFVAIRCGA